MTVPELPDHPDFEMKDGKACYFDGVFWHSIENLTGRSLRNCVVNARCWLIDEAVFSSMCEKMHDLAEEWKRYGESREQK